MTRYLLCIEYDGTPFSGWQRQEAALTVQGALEASATKLIGQEIQVFGAGRTDAGVHALGQAAHLDICDDFPAHKLADALNAHLRPHPVSILSAKAVGDSFHARFDAIKRYYHYRIMSRRADLTLDKGLVWRVPYPLDVAAMRQGAAYFEGIHDFSTFRDTQCQARTPIRSLDPIQITRRGDMVDVFCSAKSFLHRQVRSIVGSLVEVGRGRQAPEWIGEILGACARDRCGPVAPAHGLYLTKVIYPEPPEIRL